MKKLILSFMLLAMTIANYAQVPGTMPFAMPQTNPDFKDVNYAGDTLEAHRLDIYLPKEGKAPYKVIVAIYGSAWFANNMKPFAYMSLGKALTDAGYAVVSINHRSSADAKYPAQINDVKAAIRFIRAHAKAYRLDTSFIGITGFSSGGHLSSMAGVTNNLPKKDINGVSIDIEGKVGDCLNESSRVDAVVDWFGPVDMAHMNKCTTTKDDKSPEAALIGGDPRKMSEMVSLISPIDYVAEAPDCPRFLVIHGDSDTVVPHCQSENFAAVLKKAGKLVDFITVPKGQHGPVTFNENTLKKMVEFFKAEEKK